MVPKGQGRGGGLRAGIAFWEEVNDACNMTFSWEYHNATMGHCDTTIGLPPALALRSRCHKGADPVLR